MTINANHVGDTLVLAPEGRLDTLTAPEMEAAIRENLKDAAMLVLDFAKLDYISSAGLRVLLTAHKNTAGKMKITNVNELVREVFDVTGFSDVLTIE